MMKQLRFLAALVVGALFLTSPTGIAPIRSIAAVQGQPQKKEVTVWVNTRSGVYHCPGSRWYGKTKQGRYVSECEAQKAGYRPAYGKPCGPSCR